MRLAPLVLAVGCSGGTGTGSESPLDTDTTPRWSTQDTDTTPTVDTDLTPGDTDTTTVPTTFDFNGTPPASPLGLASFAGVTNRDGNARVPADLLGHPTVMWFYPAANTGG